MASEVDIANLALSHLGDSATVASLDPPEGSSQAEHCATFYPVARNELLEMHSWGFATKRVSLALVANPWTEWSYAYAMPADCLKVLTVLASDALSDYSVGLPLNENLYGVPGIGTGIYTPQDYVCETADDGSQIIYTNQVDATLRYTKLVTDTTKFSPLFTSALTRMLASYLAGPVLKGDTGMKMSVNQMQIAMSIVARAGVSDSSQQQTTPRQSVDWMAAR